MIAKTSEKSSDSRATADNRTHNQESLEALLAHVDERCRERCDEIAGRARDEADRIRRTARDRAAELLREVRARERRNLHEQIRAERARQRSRIRQRELAERRAVAEKGLEHVRSALAALWQGDADGVRAAWLQRALADARAVMTVDDWVVRHPEGWSPDDAAGALVERIAQDARIEWRPDPAVGKGFVVSAGKAVVDATPAGLTARGDRIAGVLLAEVPEMITETAS
ncbi:MAG: hypothetical protein WD397_11565 [Wenzhouxiangellaceae bacterium]